MLAQPWKREMDMGVLETAGRETVAGWDSSKRCKLV